MAECIRYQCCARTSIAMNTELFLEFVADNISNPNTRRAYTRAGRDFFRWTKAHRLTLPAIRPHHVSFYLDGLSGAAPSVNQKLAAIRMLFEWLVTGGVLSTNPAAVVRRPGHVVKVGKTSVLTTQEALTLFDSAPLGNSVGVRYKERIGVLYEQCRLRIWKEYWGE